MATARLTLYTCGVSLVGGAVILISLPGVWHAPQPFQWLLFSASVLIFGRFTLSIASVEASISVSDTFFIAAALLFGPGPAMISLALDGFLLSIRKRHSWNRVTFNTFAPALSLGVGAYAFFFLSGVPPLAAAEARVVPLLLPLLSLTLIYFGLNSGLMAMAVGLESKQPPHRIWYQHLAGLASNYVAAASAALCLVLLVKHVGLLALPIILPILAEFHRTLRTSFGRLRDAERHLVETDHLYLATIETLAMAMDAKDTVTHSHVRRVQTLAVALAGALQVTDARSLRALKTAALLHDTGKLAVPERILNKPGKLTVAEFEEMKRHVDVGADLLSLVPFPFPVVPIVRCHHENWDGTGYPRGVAGEDIPIGARILSVADCYDALTSDRPYRGRLTDGGALQIIEERRGSMYDPAVVDALLAIDPITRMAEVAVDGHDEVIRRIRSAEPAAVEPVPDSPRALEPRTAAHPADLDLSACIRRFDQDHDRATLTEVLTDASGVVQQIAPEATGAWFIPHTEDARLDATAPFGTGTALLTGYSVTAGEKLTGWVAVHRQLILNSEAALDLGDSVRAASPPLAHTLSVPVADGDQLAAVLTLYAGAGHPFSEGQSRSLQQLAPSLARAICRAQAIERHTLVAEGPLPSTPHPPTSSAPFGTAIVRR
jgi:putative nucleotidyltransferase with HDIG domain